MPSRRTGHSEDVHSSCQVTDVNSHRFCVLFVDFPTGARLDVSIQPIHPGLCISVAHRIFDGSAERLGAKFLMRSGSTFAITERCGSVIVAGMWAFDLCHALGTCGAMVSFARLSRRAATPEVENSLSQVRFVLDDERREADLHRGAFGIWPAPQTNVLAGYVVGFTGVLGLRILLVEKVAGGERAPRTAGKSGRATAPFCSRQRSRPRKPHLFLPIWRAAGR